MVFLEKTSSFLFGDPKHNSMEHRLFNAVSLINGSLNILGSFFSYHLPNFHLLFALNFGTGLILLFMYYLSRFKSVYYILFWPFNITILIFLSANWFWEGGMNGGSHYYFIPALVIATILLRDKNVILVYLLYIAVTVSVFTIEYYKPSLVVEFTSHADRFQDLLGNYVFVQILTGILIFVLSRTLNQERKKSDNLLLNILPEKIAEELKKNDKVVPVEYSSASVLFTDMAGFTQIAEKMTASELVEGLNEIFSRFDEISHKYGIQKIKTIGDAYMAAGGLPEINNTHPIDCILAGMEFLEAIREANKGRKENAQWNLRIGIHTGYLVAGVVGKQKFAYDIWGDTVNTASRLESSGIAGKINISKDTYDIINKFFDCNYRGKVKAKNKGEIDMYLVERIKPSLANESNHSLPNEEFKYLYAKMKHITTI